MNQPKTWLQGALVPPEPDRHFVMIPLTQGKFALVDEADAEWITSSGKWYAAKKLRTYYAVRADPGRHRTLLMHAVIAGFKGVDHANRNGLDNRRINLRAANQSQNTANIGLTKANKSGYKGVRWLPKCSKWIAGIRVRGQYIHLGLFSDPIEAAVAYNAAALEAYGEFAWLNPVPPRGEVA